MSSQKPLFPKCNPSISNYINASCHFSALVNTSWLWLLKWCLIAFRMKSKLLIIFSSVWLLPILPLLPYLSLPPPLSLNFCPCDFLSVPPGSFPPDFSGLSFKCHFLRDAFPDTISKVPIPAPCSPAQHHSTKISHRLQREARFNFSSSHILNRKKKQVKLMWIIYFLEIHAQDMIDQPTEFCIMSQQEGHSEAKEEQDSKSGKEISSNACKNPWN